MIDMEKYKEEGFDRTGIFIGCLLFIVGILLLFNKLYDKQVKITERVNSKLDSITSTNQRLHRDYELLKAKVKRQQDTMFVISYKGKIYYR